MCRTPRCSTYESRSETPDSLSPAPAAHMHKSGGSCAGDRSADKEQTSDRREKGIPAEEWAAGPRSMSYGWPEEPVIK